MAGLLQLRSYHGPAAVIGSSVNILDGDVRFKIGDTDDLYSDLIDGILPPTDPLTPIYTYIKNLQFYVPTPPAKFIGGCKISFDAPQQALDGVEVFVRLNASYVDPNTQLQTPLAGFTNNILLYTSQSPLVVTGASIAHSSSGPFGFFIQMQMKVTNLAHAGVLPDITLSASYTEWL